VASAISPTTVLAATKMYGAINATAPVVPRSIMIPKNEAGTAMRALLVILKLERRYVAVELRPARAPGVE
jgi:hypothetical protein